MKKLKTWQLVLLIIFYPIGIIYLIVWLCTRSKSKPQTQAIQTGTVNVTFRDTDPTIEVNDKNLARIIGDGLNILATTTNIDTFFSRYDLIVKRLDEFEHNSQRWKYKIMSRYWIYIIPNCKDEFIAAFIERSYVEMLIKARELSTPSGRENRVIKFFAELEKYEGQMLPNNISRFRELKADNSTPEQINANISNAEVIGQTVDNSYIQTLAAMISPEAYVLKDDFRKKYYVESENRCKEFQNLASAANNEKNINYKVELLEKALNAFENARQWHYTHSQGARVYFFNEFEHNDLKTHKGWSENIEEQLNLQRVKCYSIVPWISEKSREGFIQNDIYKAFPDMNKAFLRKCIDELVDSGALKKEKKGNSFFITCSNIIDF